MKLISLEHDPIKKYKATLLDDEGKEHTVRFGSRGYQDFTMHREEARKALYLGRHGAREDWTDPLTAGFWARWLLWNKKTIRESLRDIQASRGVQVASELL